ncbi:phage holin family protein [Paraburkholderia sediminicola]|uniref:phage holin family protein n=1 Tax=Paraburkholderia sediminicola TaxID=458836 RepID=UPI0038BCAC97
MPTAAQLKSFVSFWLLLFWSVAAFAAQATFVSDLRDIPPAAMAISCLLAIIGGAAYTASKLAAPDVQVKSVSAEVVKDLLTSVVAGFCVFCLGSYMEWPSVVQAGLITLAGYGGSRVLEPMLAALISRGSRFLGGDPAPALPSPTVAAPDSAPTDAGDAK